MFHQWLKTQVSNSRDVLQCYASSQAGDQQQKRKQKSVAFDIFTSPARTGGRFSRGVSRWNEEQSSLWWFCWSLPSSRVAWTLTCWQTDHLSNTGSTISVAHHRNGLQIRETQPAILFNLFRCSVWHQYYVPREGSLENPTHTFYFSKYSLWHQHNVPRKGSPRRVYAYLAVTCHLHFWQNDRDLLCATAVTRGWNGYQNKSQHRKLTMEKKILLPLLQGLEPETF